MRCNIYYRLIVCRINYSTSQDVCVSYFGGEGRKYWQNKKTRYLERKLRRPETSSSY